MNSVAREEIRLLTILCIAMSRRIAVIRIPSPASFSFRARAMVSEIAKSIIWSAGLSGERMRERMCNRMMGLTKLGRKYGQKFERYDA